MYDQRGMFVKTFNVEIFKSLGIFFDIQEEFFSESKLGVIRGMHFQLPPHQHKKLVYCQAGAVLDVLLDLRKGSNYGAAKSFEISAENKNIIYIPEGVAHGFKSLSANATMIYKTSTIHIPSADFGIKWDSFGFNWGNGNFTISERDQRHVSFGEFHSPFGLQ